MVGCGCQLNGQVIWRRSQFQYNLAEMFGDFFQDSVQVIMMR